MGETKKLYTVTKKLQPKGGHSGRKKAQKTTVRPRYVIAGVALVVLIFTLPYLFKIGDRTRGAAPPEGNWKYCLDISHHNGSGIIWDSLRVVVDHSGFTSRDILSARDIYPLSAVYIKASEGTSMKDRRFKENWEGAAGAGIPRGAYHFFRSSTSPLEQARNFIEAVGELRSSDLSPVLDIETIHKGCSREELCSKAMVWLEAVGSHYGRTPMIYTSDSFARDILSDKIKADYPLWIARYNTVPPKTVGWKLWQFTDRAVVHGLKGEADLSVMK